MLVRRPPTIRTESAKRKNSFSTGNEGINEEVVLSPKKLMIEKEATIPRYSVEDNLEICQKSRTRTQFVKKNSAIYHINQSRTLQQTDLDQRTKINLSPPKQSKDSNGIADDCMEALPLPGIRSVTDFDFQAKEDQNKRGSVTAVQERTSLHGFVSILTNVFFVRHLVMTCFGTAAAFGILFMMPSLAKEWGANDFVSSSTVTIVVVCHLAYVVCVMAACRRKLYFVYKDQ